MVIWLLQELSWLEIDASTHLFNWMPYSHSKLRDPEEWKFIQGTFDSSIGRHWAERWTEYQRVRLEIRLEDQIKIEETLMQQHQEWSNEIIEAMASSMMYQLYSPSSLPVHLTGLIGHVIPVQGDVQQHLAEMLHQRRQSPPIFVLLPLYVPRGIRENINTLLLHMKRREAYLELSKHFLEQLDIASVETVRLRYLLNSLTASIAQGRRLVRSRGPGGT